jgi:hypothetical protein
MTKLRMNYLISMHWSHTKKAETRRRKGRASKEQEESVDGEVRHDDIWSGEKSCADCLEVKFVRLPIILRTGINVSDWIRERP